MAIPKLGWSVLNPLCVIQLKLVQSPDDRETKRIVFTREVKKHVSWTFWHVEACGLCEQEGVAERCMTAFPSLQKLGM